MYASKELSSPANAPEPNTNMAQVSYREGGGKNPCPYCLALDVMGDCLDIGEGEDSKIARVVGGDSERGSG
jgi:hypothetical protein